MNKVITCGSIVASDEIIAAQKELGERGFEVKIPWGVQRYIENNFQHIDEEERHKDKKIMI